MTDEPSSGVVWVDAQLPPALARWLRETHGVEPWPRVAALLASGEPLVEVGRRT